MDDEIQVGDRVQWCAYYYERARIREIPMFGTVVRIFRNSSRIRVHPDESPIREWTMCERNELKRLPDRANRYK